MIVSPEDDSGELARRIDAICQRASHLASQNPEKATRLYETAVNMANSVDSSLPQIQGALSRALIGLAKANSASNPALAAKYCLQVINVIGDAPSPELGQAQVSLGWIHFYLGDYPATMEWAYKSLKTSEAIKSAESKATALDLIASVHGTLNEFDKATEAHERVLDIVHSSQVSEYQTCILLNNIATTYLYNGNIERSIELCQQSIFLAQKMKRYFELVNGYNTLADAYTTQRNLVGAKNYLKLGLDKIAGAFPLLEVYCLKSMAEISILDQDLDLAATQFRQALAIADGMGAKNLQAACHESLAGVCERLGNFRKALEHYKTFHRLSNEVVGEKSTQRLALLNVVHEVEKAKDESELHRLRSLSLMVEIDEQRRKQSQLEILAMKDPLTNLFNRRAFFEVGEKLVRQSKVTEQSFSIVMLDLDHFKYVNDHFGHPVGDEVLVEVAERMQSCCRTSDLSARLGGEEFAIMLPDTALEAALTLALRLCQTFSSTPILTSAGQVTVTFSAGVASFLATRDPDLDFPTLLRRADDALLIAKKQGRNRVVPWSNGINPTNSQEFK